MDNHTERQHHHRNRASSANKPLRILLVDDHAPMREALKALLETDPELEIVGEAATFAEALEAVDRLKPTVPVIDIGLPDRSGIALAAELKARRSPTRVLVLTAYATMEHVRAALNAGALGYVLKDATHADLLKGLRAVSVGQMLRLHPRNSCRCTLPQQFPRKMRLAIDRQGTRSSSFQVAMYVADCFIRTPDKASSDFVLAHTISDDTVQVPVDHRCELIKRFHALPFRPRTPTCEKPLRRHRTRPRSLNEHSGRDKQFSALKHEDVVNA